MVDLKHREGRSLAMIGIDLIGFLLPSEGIRPKYSQLIDYSLIAAGGAR
jgi:hypothetical protein